MNRLPSSLLIQTDYSDLEIRILKLEDEGYPVEITLNGEQEFPRGYLGPDFLPWVPSASPRQDGERLFEWLFADDRLKTAWAEVRGQAPQRRIRLRIDATAAELHAAPWELLQEGPVMLSAQADTPFSRYLPIALPWSGAVEKRPIRVLVVISDPDDLETQYGLAPVDVALERERLETALSTVGPDELQADFLDAPVTPERLEEALRDGYHVLHFVGHGAFSAERGQAVLYMQDEEGHVKQVRDDELVSMVARQGVRPRLVTLVACQSAARSTTDAFLGLGPKLVTVGVPAVVAMQDVVTVETARLLSATFYPRLLEHGQVDLAINEARSALLTARRADAAVPVLFMRLKSGQLWGGEADARGAVLGGGKPKAFWNSLMQDIEDRKCTPIIGPRVHGRWLPTPGEVARRLSEKYAYPFASKDDLARVTQYMVTTATSRKERFARREFLDTLMAEFVTRLPEGLRSELAEGLHPEEHYDSPTELIQAVGWPGLVADDPNEVHQVLASLNLPLYLTTNPDSFMVEALAAQGKQPVREICRWDKRLDRLPSRFDEEDAYEPTPNAPLVYHLFGSDEKISSLVLTEDHYLSFLVRISNEQDRIPNILREALADSTLMFLGYGLYDWEFRVLMHGLVASLQQYEDIEHVAVQLEFEEAGEADIETVQTFLQDYFRRAADINVFWGSPAQFIAELREHWEARHR